jgi:hypothetical protein
LLLSCPLATSYAVSRTASIVLPVLLAMQPTLSEGRTSSGEFESGSQASRLHAPTLRTYEKKGCHPAQQIEVAEFPDLESLDVHLFPY